MNKIKGPAVIALAVSMTIGLSACGAGGSPAGPQPSPTSSTASSAPVSLPAASEGPRTAGTSAPATAITTPGNPGALSSLPNGGQWLYALKHESTRPVAETTAVLEGDASGTVYAESTSQFMGCEGTADETSYQLDGAFSILKAQVGLRAGTPAGIKAIVDVYVDDALISRLQIDSDGGAPLQVVLTGGQTLTFSVSKGTGECAYSEQGYLVFGDAQVS